jgi:glyoxylase-like metal-dependent hydrolase (beta-lactamase superfamily II)
MKLLHSLLLICTFLFSSSALAYTPKAEKVVDSVYAIIGPLGQRSADNNGLNANMGFIVTDDGVILIDSGASKLGAQQLEQAVAAITPRPIKWVINSGSQDHRWLGNDYFASKGAEIIAMARTAQTQAQYAKQHMAGLRKFLGKRLDGTVPLPAEKTLAGDKASVTLGGVKLELRYTDAHFPGDAWIWLPQQKVLFSGDLIYVDRVFAVLPWSSVKHGQRAFHAMEALQPKYIVPGHGRVSDLARARRDTGDYYDFLNKTIGSAAEAMENMEEVLNRYNHLPQFEHLEHFDELHRTNMNRSWLEYEEF